MKTNLIFFMLLMMSSILAAQDMVVEPVIVTSAINPSSQSKIPHVVDRSGEYTRVAEKMNQSIMDHFYIPGFDPAEITSFDYSNMDFDYEINDNVLLISYWGENYNSFTGRVNQNLFFDLLTGEKLEELRLELQAVLSLEGYYSFLNKFWLPGCTTSMNRATQCAEQKPYCDCYDIIFNQVESQAFLSLTTDCYPQLAWACSPVYSIQVPTDPLNPYLNDFGLGVLIKSNFGWSTPLEKYLYLKHQLDEIPQYAYLTGKIAGKYPFSMAFELNENTHQAQGYYYYHKQGKSIQLSGDFSDGLIHMNESVGGQVTGRFEIQISMIYEAGAKIDGSFYWSGKWFDPAGKELSIEIEDVKYYYPASAWLYK